MSTKVTVVARMQARPGMEARLKEELLHMVAETRKEEGCINYDLHQSPDDPAKFLFYENWTSRAHLDRHAQSAHIQSFRSRAGDLLVAPTEIALWTMLYGRLYAALRGGHLIRKLTSRKIRPTLGVSK